MTETENATLPEIQEGECEMPEIVCVGCGNRHAVTYQGYLWGGGREPGGKIRGVLTCRHPMETKASPTTYCNRKTLFEFTGNAALHLKSPLN